MSDLLRVERQCALPTAVDIVSVCQIEGCTSSQYNLDPSAVPAVSAVPEPGTWALMLGGLGGLGGLAAWAARLASDIVARSR